MTVLMKTDVVQGLRVIKKGIPHIFRAENVYLGVGHPDLPNHCGNVRDLAAVLPVPELVL
jgi:hypothetical protein